MHEQEPMNQPNQPNMLERATDFIRKNTLEFAVGAVAAMGGATLPQEAFAKANAHQAEITNVEHKTTTFSTQRVLDNIRHIITPCDVNIGCVKWDPATYMTTIHPTSAYIDGSSGEYRDSCTRYANFSYWAISTGGYAAQGCGGEFVNGDPRTTAGQFQQPLNQLGLKIEKLFKLSYPEGVSSASGNRNKVQINYECTDDSSSNESGVENIIMQKAFKTVREKQHYRKDGHVHTRWVKERKQYSKATITPCPDN